MPDDGTGYAFADWWHEREERAGMRGEYPDTGSDFEEPPPDAEEPEPLSILTGRTLEDVRAKQPEDVIQGRLAVRENTTAMSSKGGDGKTTLMVQQLIEGSLQEPVWGVEDFRPTKATRGLYVNAEDSIRNTNYTLGRILPAYGLKRVPYDELLIAENGGRFVLTPLNAALLAKRINEEGYDLVVFDPAISFLPTGIKFIDPAAIRGFLNDGLGVLQRETRAALWLNHHDNKAGDALSGPADWGNFTRLALHLERGDRDGTITVTTVKTNLGYRFKKITLERDPETGRATAIEIERFGDRSAKPTSLDDVNKALAQLVRMEIIPLPSEERTKNAVIPKLHEKAARDDLKISRDRVRDFVNAHCRFEERKIGRHANCKVLFGLTAEMESSC